MMDSFVEAVPSDIRIDKRGISVCWCALHVLSCAATWPARACSEAQRSLRPSRHLTCLIAERRLRILVRAEAGSTRQNRTYKTESRPRKGASFGAI